MLGAVGGFALSLAPGAGARSGIAREKLGEGRRQSLNQGWQFLKTGDDASDDAPPAAGAWRNLDLPHDWSIEDRPQSGTSVSVGPFDRNAVGGAGAGFAVGGQGWYRRHFNLGVAAPGRVEVVFDGVYLDSDVWLNGHHLGHHRNGYTRFGYDLTPHLSADGSNELLVRTRNIGVNQRWYSGSGVYRDVWLDVLADAAYIVSDSVQVVTRELVRESARIELTTEIEQSAGTKLAARILDSDGRKVWEDSFGSQTKIKRTIDLASPRLWSPSTPDLYRLEVELRRGERLIDTISMPFGLRIVSFDAQNGMLLNGETTKLRGGCIHHDNGILGAAAFHDAEERKVALLKARGFNAVRPSHNPFSQAFLDACDRLGMMVICETFDVWQESKFSELDYSRYFKTDWQNDLSAIVRSARHHPSVIMWSIGNEIPGRNSPEGIALQWQLANRVHELDPTRPVTAAIHGFPGLEVTAASETARAGTTDARDRASTVFLDVVGYNYKLADYDVDHARFPGRVFFGSESFPSDLFSIWDLAERSPWMIGDFVWTAMDYLGEAGIGGSEVVPKGANGPGPGTSPWPWVNAYCGDIDLIGAQKPASHARDVVWGVSPIEMLVRRPVPAGQLEKTRLWGWHDELPSWTWPGHEGTPLVVSIYTAGDRVSLHLNGKEIETRVVTVSDRKQVRFNVPYAPGNLEAVAFRGNVELGRRALVSSGSPASVHLTQEARGGLAGSDDLTFVGIEVVDDRGRPVPDARNLLDCTVEGAGELLAFGSADPHANSSYRSGQAPAWHGRALAVIRGKGAPGRAVLRVRGEGLAPGSLSIDLSPAIGHVRS